MKPRLHHLYHYVSDRWLNDAYLMARERSRQRDTNIGFHIPLPLGPSIEIDNRAREADAQNRYKRAQEVFEILDSSDFIDSLGAASEGRFVWADIPLTLATLPVMGLRRPVAWMYASYEDPAAGRTFISFCGSVNNYIGYAAGDKEAIDDWYPSASPGLHAIIESLSNERRGVGDWTRLMSEPGRREFYNLLSALSELPRGHVVGQAFMEALAIIFHSEHDVEIKFDGPSGVRGHFDTVLVGAPLWVRSAAARPLGNDRHIPQGFERSIEGVWSQPGPSRPASRRRRRWLR
jgi:hypothetical protein